MKLVVITGCLGLIGSHVTKKCLTKGWKVYGIDKCTYAANLNFLKDYGINIEEKVFGIYERKSIRIYRKCFRGAKR